MSRDDLADETAVLVQTDPDDPSNGRVTGPGDARISPLDRGFLYGDAAFETVRWYGDDPAFLPAHVDRLDAALAELSIPAEFGVEGLTARVDRLRDWLFEDPADNDAYVRVSVTRGDRSGVLSPTETDPTLVAIAKPLTTRRYDPATVETVETRRRGGPLSRLKTHNYLPGVLAKGETNADEALMRDDRGAVASGAASNVVAVQDGTLVTPDRNVRPGVTREAVLDVAADLGIDTRLAPVDLDAAEAAVLTNTTWGVRPVRSVDGDPLATDHDLVRTVAEAYFDRVVP
ncbi:4-amino-4-deoxychorismate lyase [Halobacteriales archaeon QS_8_69_26]|nr:MAG: 4-amino-4-deoxychorismate lyase [Halobacteriales archaeon QS_8_69_26]